ncbi:hypothetical protein KC331_g13315 [Hortaea werneckii]|uniref:Uncharacterized protein n=1 Tax=Hortaea werneckii TaxID=91943 RepID=A0A3M7BBE4_HORWE|nr:hypothetical protein KC331_g13315 [Hortaea werneckii]KAI7710351.1 hypothetical protein KC353_g9752 [Hortaea werneckii]RMY37162.1 hypothetical protein D0865_13446 [Hortaea werneckii]
MARYPTFEEYDAAGNHSEGIKRCDELLQRSPNDINLLTTKFKLLSVNSSAASAQEQENNRNSSTAVLNHFTTLPTPIQDPSDLCRIEMAVVESHATTYPPSTTAGPQVAKLWDNAVKASPNLNHKLELISTRWERAVFDSRTADMQQTLIQLKALQPRNRVVYMTHAALTQMLSLKSDDLSAKLALGLARKAVSEKFDQEGAGLDCRVPGQVFAMQGAQEDVEKVKGTRFGESKQVWEFLRKGLGEQGVNGGEGEKGAAGSDPSKVDGGQESLPAEIEKSKQQFANLIRNQAPSLEIRSFATNAIRLFHTSTTSGARRSPADACFVAISATVRLFEQTTSQHYLLHAAYLAESLLRVNEHIHEARLILVYLYMRLGLASLAMKYFDSLNVKEIQNDTVGHVLFTRLSSLHPHPTTVRKKETYDPLKQLRRILDVYVRCEDKLADTEANVLHHGQTGMLFDLHELRDSLRFSQTRRLALLEWRRIGRLMRNKCDDHDALSGVGPQVARNWIEARDNRDFNAAFDFGYNVETVLHGVDGKVPGQAWVAYSLIADSVWSLATGQQALISDAEGLRNEVASMLQDVAGGSITGITEPERLAGELAVQLLSILIHAQSKTSDETKLSESLTSTTVALDNLKLQDLLATDDSLAEHLEHHYVYADAVRLLIATCAAVISKSPEPGVKEKFQALQQRAKDLFTKIQRHATEQQARRKAAGVRQLMAKDDDEEVWKELQAFGGGKEMDGFCEDVAKAAKEGWEGLGRVKFV